MKLILSRQADEQRRLDLARQRQLEREERRGGLPLHALGERDPDHEDLPDCPPPRWARSGSR